jgi:hypothetical protein
MREWEKELAAYYPALEKLVRHAESAGVTIVMKPHTGISANAKTCMALLKRIPSERLKICWDAGNVSFYEGIHPDPDLPELAPQVKAVCVKDHLGLRGEVNFPTPGQGQIDHEQLFRTLFGAGFNGPMGIERLNGRTKGKLAPEAVDERLADARALVRTATSEIRPSRPPSHDARKTPSPGGLSPRGNQAVSGFPRLFSGKQTLLPDCWDWYKAITISRVHRASRPLDHGSRSCSIASSRSATSARLASSVSRGCGLPGNVNRVQEASIHPTGGHKYTCGFMPARMVMIPWLPYCAVAARKTTAQAART